MHICQFRGMFEHFKVYSFIVQYGVEMEWPMSHWVPAYNAYSIRLMIADSEMFFVFFSALFMFPLG